MGYPTKIATCCHWGTKAALRLDGARHALSCASCGAPLSKMKMLPVAEPVKTAVSHQGELRRFPKKPKAVEAKRKKPRKQKKRKKWFKDLIEDAFDVVEDIFD